MHKVELRLTNEGNDEAANVFELYTEALGDKGYAESGPMQEVAGGGAPVVLFLEPNERIIVVAKGNKGQLVFDKEQNANVRVETEEERKQRAERETKVARHHADQAVAGAQARVTEAQDSAKHAEDDANAGVKKAETDRAKIDADAAKNRAAASERTSPNPAIAGGVSAPRNPGSPASANTGPVDSKQVKP